MLSAFRTRVCRHVFWVYTLQFQVMSCARQLMRLEAVIVSKLSQSRTIKPDHFSSAVFQGFYIVMSNVYILSNRLYTYNKWKFVKLSGRKGA